MGESAVCVEIAMDGSMDKENASRIVLKRDHQFVVDGTEEELFTNEKQAKEVSSEDLNSEVSNPIVSLRENTPSCHDITSQSISPRENMSSCHDITSQLVSPRENVSNCHNITIQPTELAQSNQVGSGEVTSTFSGDSSPVDTLSEEGDPSCENNTSQSDTPQNDTSSSVSTTRVIMEIPKNANTTTGIRKITFKFSKRKEDYDTQKVTSVAEPVNNGISQGLSYAEMPLGGGNRYICSPNTELKISKEVVPYNYPTNVKKLLSTGILNGARVKYISVFPEHELDGIIYGSGYLCGCSMCNFSNVLSAYEFEQHAGVKTRHPNNHIYLENRKPIYSIIQELKTAPLSKLDEVIKDVAGSSINEEFFQVWKAKLQQSNEMVGAGKRSYSKLDCLPHSLLSYPNQGIGESCTHPYSYFLYNNSVNQQTQMAASQERKRALKRPGCYISNSMSQKRTADGGTKKRDNDLHRLLFMPNGLPNGTELAYYVKGQKLLEGRKQGNGILCNCCNREISPSLFESHAGMAARRQPYRHIYASNGLTLHDIAVSLANGQKVSATGISDDMCAKCGDGGDLLPCESCPRAFHRACLDLQHDPKGVWHCPECTKFGHGGNGSRPIVIRLNRVVKTPECEIGGCNVCRAHDFSNNGFNDRTVILCDQCEKEFHIGCLRDSGLCDLKELPKENWFCSGECNNIYVALQNSVASGTQKIPALQLDALCRKHVQKGYFIDRCANDIQFQILLGKTRETHCRLLSAATAIFRECFAPIVAKSGRDLIPVMVYGRNISGQEFGRMHSVLLFVNGVVVSAALLRIFGREVAELPLVATSREHQGKGFFQSLFSCIERLLCSMNVENLVLPAAEEAESIWTKKFGFKKMSEARLSKYMRDYQLTVFRCTSMLEKEVPRMEEQQLGLT